MSHKKSNSKNIVFAAVLLVLFGLFLGGLMLWEHGGQGTAPVVSQPAQTMPSTQTVPTTAPTVPTTVPTEQTRPTQESRRLNFLLVGRDAHGEGENGRSDSMILCSVDTGSKTVTMISFLRDIYLPIPGRGSSRLNSAYSWGGAELLMQTLEENFGVAVDVTLEIDFDGFETLIDLLGGVDIELTAQEASHMNSGHGWSLTEGVNHLTGEQALSYSRIRKLDSDFGRTERQRNVLTALMQKYRSASLQEMLNVADAFLDQSTSNRTDNELLGYALELYPTLAEASLVTQQIPADDTWNYVTIHGMSVISVDFDENRQILAELLYSGNEETEAP